MHFLRSLKMFMLYLLVIFVHISASEQFCQSRSYDTDEYDLSHLETVEDLKAVVVLFRHGDRSPLYSYPANPQKPNVWAPGGLDKLTAKGMQQANELGRFFRARYGSLLDPATALTDQVHMETSGTSRTIACAQLFAAGAFPPTSSQTWDTSQLSSIWQPVPVFSRDIDDRDAIFGVSLCPLHQHTKNNLQDYPQFASVQQRYANLTALVKAKTELHNFVFPRTYYALNDIFYAQRQHNIPLPDWMTPSVEHDMNFLSDLFYSWMLGGVNRTADYAKFRIRLRGGNLLRVMMEDLTRKVNDSLLTSDVKTFAYSGHDDNIGATLAAFGLYPYVGKDKPGHINYNSAVVFELFNNDTVRIVFKNNRPEKPTGNPEVLIHPECTELCPVEQLVKLSTPFFMGEAEWFQLCQTPVVPRRPTVPSHYDIEHPDD